MTAPTMSTSAITSSTPSSSIRSANLSPGLSPMSSHTCYPCPRSIHPPGGGSGSFDGSLQPPSAREAPACLTNRPVGRWFASRGRLHANSRPAGRLVSHAGTPSPARGQGEPSNELEPPSRREAGGSGAVSRAVRRTASMPRDRDAAFPPTVPTLEMRGLSPRHSPNVPPPTAENGSYARLAAPAGSALAGAEQRKAYRGADADADE